MGAHVHTKRKKRNEQKREFILRIVVTQKRKLNVTVCYVRSRMRMGMVMDMVTEYFTCKLGSAPILLWNINSLHYHDLVMSCSSLVGFGFFSFVEMK